MSERNPFTEEQPRTRQLKERRERIATAFLAGAIGGLIAVTALMLVEAWG